MVNRFPPNKVDKDYVYNGYDVSELWNITHLLWIEAEHEGNTFNLESDEDVDRFETRPDIDRYTCERVCEMSAPIPPLTIDRPFQSNGRYKFDTWFFNCDCFTTESALGYWDAMASQLSPRQRGALFDSLRQRFGMYDLSNTSYLSRHTDPQKKLRVWKEWTNDVIQNAPMDFETPFVAIIPAAAICPLQDAIHTRCEHDPNTVLCRALRKNVDQQCTISMGNNMNILL